MCVCFFVHDLTSVSLGLPRQAQRRLRGAAEGVGAHTVPHRPDQPGIQILPAQVQGSRGERSVSFGLPPVSLTMGGEIQS